jgi:hypothetical protein
VYDYLKAGNDTALLQKLTDRTPTGADDVTTYVYDDLDRLDTAITAGSNPSSYNYDLSPGGRRTQEVRQDPGAASPTITTYGYNAGNQLTSINGSTANLAYDLNGNQTQSPSFGTLTVNARDPAVPSRPWSTPAPARTTSSPKPAPPCKTTPSASPQRPPAQPPPATSGPLTATPSRRPPEAPAATSSPTNADPSSASPTPAAHAPTPTSTTPTAAPSGPRTTPSATLAAYVLPAGWCISKPATTTLLTGVGRSATRSIRQRTYGRRLPTAMPEATR